MTQSEVAIYTPHTAGLYDRVKRRAGGAERQMHVLADVLANRGVRVAQIVYPIANPPQDLPPGLRLVDRGPHATRVPITGKPVELFRILKALWRADGQVYVVRSAIPMLGLIGAFCRIRRRPLIFSAANNSDFVEDKFRGSPLKRLAYRLGVALTTVVVVQSDDQLGLLRATFPRARRVRVIPSMAEDPVDADVVVVPESFVWIGRLVDYKQPLRFPELARAFPEARFVMIPALHATPLHPEDALLATLVELAEEIPNLEVRQSLPRDQLMPIIESAVAVVNTAVFEGMPNVFLEAWARGVPVLTLEFDPDDVVATHGLGIAAGGSWASFVDGAELLWRQRTDRAELSRHLKEYVARTHSRSSVGAQWEALIRELTRGGPTA